MHSVCIGSRVSCGRNSVVLASRYAAARNGSCPGAVQSSTGGTGEWFHFPLRRLSAAAGRMGGSSGSGCTASPWMQTKVSHRE
jgi:hypothetical protein